MSVTETILQSFTFAFDTTKVIQIYETPKLFRLINVKKNAACLTTGHIPLLIFKDSFVSVIVLRFTIAMQPIIVGLHNRHGNP